MIIGGPFAASGASGRPLSELLLSMGHPQGQRQCRRCGMRSAFGLVYLGRAPLVVIGANRTLSCLLRLVWDFELNRLWGWPGGLGCRMAHSFRGQRGYIETRHMCLPESASLIVPLGHSLAAMVSSNRCVPLLLHVIPCHRTGQRSDTRRVGKHIIVPGPRSANNSGVAGGARRRNASLGTGGGLENQK